MDISRFEKFEIARIERTRISNAPYNPRRISAKNRATLKTQLETQGLVMPLVWNIRTGNLVSGHQRISILDDLEGTQNYRLTVSKINVDPETEKKLNVFLNNSNAMGEYDNDLLKQIFSEADTLDGFGFESAQIENILQAEHTKALFSDVSDDLTFNGLRALRAEKSIDFPSNLKYDFPELRPDLLADCPQSISCWAGEGASAQTDFYLYNYGTDSTVGLDLARTVLAFYTQDEAWEHAVWTTADDFVHKIINGKIIACVTPNFSVWWEKPQAYRLWNFFRNRWVGRFWQECGVRVIPDVQTPPRDYDFCLEGIPTNAPCLAFQFQTTAREKKNEDEFYRQKVIGFDMAINTLKPQAILIYANTNGITRLASHIPKELHYIWIETRVALRQKYIEARKESRWRQN